VGRDLAAGATIEASDLVWLRPATGFPPGEESQVVGRHIVRDLRAGTLITAADLA
jgi:sialic acid synthase SpsE